MSRKSLRPGSSIPRPDDLSNHLVRSSHPLKGDEVGTRLEDDNTDGDVVQPDSDGLASAFVDFQRDALGILQVEIGHDHQPIIGCEGPSACCTHAAAAADDQCGKSLNL